MDEHPVDPFEMLEKYRAAGQPGKAGSYPVGTRSEMRDVARLLTLGNPAVRARLNKEAEDGTMPIPIFIELVRQGYGMAEQKVRLDETARPRPQLRTLRPIGYDPVTGQADQTIIEGVYEHVPELSAHAPTPVAPRPSPTPPPDHRAPRAGGGGAQAAPAAQARGARGGGGAAPRRRRLADPRP